MSINQRRTDGRGQLYDSILDTIGNTPIVSMPRMSPKPGVHLFAKLEGTNPTGSVKDRIANYMIADAEKKGAVIGHPNYWMSNGFTERNLNNTQIYYYFTPHNK